MIRQIINILLLLSLHYEASAQLSMIQYQQEVVNYSWELKEAENEVKSADGSIALKQTLRLPELLATGRFDYYMRQSDGIKPWASTLSPELVQTIYGGGVIKAEIEQSEITYQSAICSAQFTLLEVIYAANYAYWNYWAMLCYNRAMIRYVEIIEREADAINRRIEEGYTAKGDLLMIESRLSEAQYELISSEQSKIIALSNLNILRGLKPTSPTTLNYPHRLISESHEQHKIEITPPQRVSIEQVIDQRPDYSAAQLSELSAQVATRAVKGSYNPQLKGGVRAIWSNLTPNFDGTTQLNGTAFVELSMPIYHFSERRKATNVSEIAEHQSTIASAKLRDQIISEESSAWITLIESRAQVEAASKSLLIANNNLDISTFAYNEGEVSIVDLMQAQISWIQIYTNAITSEYNYRLAEAAYNKAVGKINY